MASPTIAIAHCKPRGGQVNGLRVECSSRKRERDRELRYPYKVVEITPPPRDLGVRCFPLRKLKVRQIEAKVLVLLICLLMLTYIVGESVTIEGQAYTVSAVTHRYQLRKGKYEPSDKRLDVQSTGRYILNMYLENLLDQS